MDQKSPSIFAKAAGAVLPAGGMAWLAANNPRIVFAPEGAAVAGLADVAVADKPADGGGDKTADTGKAAEPGKVDPKVEPAKADDPAKKVEKPLRPDWLPESIWDADKGFKANDFNALVAHKAESDSRAASLPASADKYEVKLPPDFKLPDGIKLKDGEKLIDDKDPRIAAARDFAHAHTMTQGEFEKLIALGVNMDLAERSEINKLVGTEREKLGTRSVERINAVVTWLNAKLGPELGGSLHGMMFTGRQIEAFERLMQPNRGDIPGNPGASRDGQPAEISDEDYAKMSPVEKLQYARQHSPAPKKK